MMSARVSLCLALLILAGCATKNVNTTVAKRNTGYVDVYCGGPDAIGWEISRWDSSKEKFKRIFSDIEPLEEDILRLGLEPGQHRLKITVLNRVTHGSVLIDAKVEDGMITPLKVTLSAAGAAKVKEKEIKMGAKVRGRRGISLNYDDTTMYEVSAEAGVPVAYAVKEKMPYGQ